MTDKVMEEHLREKLIPFWKKLADRQRGGFFGYMDSGLRVDRDAVKGCILNSRILWFFSNASMTLKDETLKEYADHAYAFLRDACYDTVNGGVYWALDCEGNVTDATKHTYNLAFAVYALSSCYRAFGNSQALKLAENLVDTIEEKCFDKYGYVEAQDREFRPVPNEKLSENGVMADRTMNTLLHVMEAYTEYYLASGEVRIKRKLFWILDMLAERVYNPQKHRLEVFFDNDMNSLIDLHSYGHDIETAWLVDRTLSVLQNEDYSRRLSTVIRDLESEIYRTAFRKHSLPAECEKGKVDERRIWWVQAEGVIGFYNAFQKTGKEEYRRAAEEIWEFIQKYIVDSRDGGEWFYNTDAEGMPEMERPIVEPWKCPYHNGRMCMEMIRRLQS